MRKPTVGVHRFYINGFALDVYDSAYLVKIRPCEEKDPALGSAADLPDWALRSKNAIWLADGSGPILNRAILGDQVKEQLLQSPKGF